MSSWELIVWRRSSKTREIICRLSVSYDYTCECLRCMSEVWYCVKCGSAYTCCSLRFFRVVTVLLERGGNGLLGIILNICLVLSCEVPLKHTFNFLLLRNANIYNRRMCNTSFFFVSLNSNLAKDSLLDGSYFTPLPLQSISIKCSGNLFLPSFNNSEINTHLSWFQRWMLSLVLEISPLEHLILTFSVNLSYVG